MDCVSTQGSRLHVLSAAYSPAAPDEHRLEATAEALYLMMGRGLERLPVQRSHSCSMPLPEPAIWFVASSSLTIKRQDLRIHRTALQSSGSISMPGHAGSGTRARWHAAVLAAWWSSQC